MKTTTCQGRGGAMCRQLHAKGEGEQCEDNYMPRERGNNVKTTIHAKGEGEQCEDNYMY